ncbi:MAG TPA: Nudix family hydrolase [Candidatus Saccharimonadia bacterium]|nr:Nudix family hydrolase [Candidatus Saccharimonadia bacterium]
MKRIHVVAGILRDAAGRVLLAQRGAGKHLAGLWEFPGGKVEHDESPLAALRRELREEIGVEVDAAEPLVSVPWTYPEKHVDLDVHEITAWRGEPHGREGQALAWCAADALDRYEMPPADRPVVTALRLPRRMFVTPAMPGDDGRVIEHAIAAVVAGTRLVQLRVPGLGDARLAEIASALHDALRPHRAELLVNGSIGIAQALGVGLHLSAAAARRHASRPIERRRWFGVSAHDLDELAHAVVLDADYVVLGPVAPTASHPGAAAIGWPGFAALARRVPMPSFAIGGLGPDDVDEARRHGAFGVAGIRAFLKA